MGGRRVGATLAALAAALAAGSGPATASGDPAGPGAPDVLAIWSQVFGATEAAGGPIAPEVEMRFVIPEGADCAAFDVERRMTAEGPWEPARPAVSRNGPAPALDVEVCAVAMQTDGAAWREGRLTRGGAEVRLVSRQPLGDTAATVGQAEAPGPADGAAARVWGATSIGARREGGALLVASLGDTGCRGLPASAAKPSLTPADAARLERMRQDCDTASWPLAELAVAAAAQAPDLVIHVGDYRYFLEDEQPAPENRWLYWRKDFFPAAQPLLLAAPLVAARGNHESCGAWGFGPGYFQLFGPGAVAGCAGARDPLPPEAFDVAPGGLGSGDPAAAHRFVVLDTNDDAAEGLADRYRAAMALTRAKGAPESAWWITHVPAIMLIDYDGRSHTGDPALQADLVAAAGGASLADWFCGPEGAPRCRPSQTLTGHQHLFQTVTFPVSSPGASLGEGAPGDRWLLPRQAIVGHGGTRIDDASPAPAGALLCRSDSFAALAPPGAPAPAALVETVTRHGIVLWRRDPGTLGLPAGWEMQPIWAGAAPPPAPVAGLAEAAPACLP